jgi:hypothetical protein
MIESAFAPPALGLYSVRRFAPNHARGVTRLIELIYGNSYYPRDLYDPMQIVRLNSAGKLVSVLALNAAAEVVGHYALERPHLTAVVAEASDAVVRPDCRHHHLMEQMRLVLRQEAQRLGLVGLVGYPVTNHLFSQKADEHIGAHPCGVALGLWPNSFHNMPEALPQRMSFVIYFRYLRSPEPVVHVATRHHPVCERICRQYGVPVQPCDPAPPTGAGDVTLEHEPEVQAGTIRVHRVGADSAAAVREARVKLCDGFGARALTLELPLAQPGTAEVCRAAEEDGFFFSGVGPAFAADGDALLLQFLADDLDLSLVQIENAFAMELLAYAAREWQTARSISRV